MRFVFTLYLVSISTISVLVFAQNKDFSQTFIKNNNEIDGGFAISPITYFPYEDFSSAYRLQILIIGRDYWIYDSVKDILETNSRRLPEGFDSECVTMFCVNHCGSRDGSLGCLKVSQFKFSFISLGKYNELIDFRTKVLRMALISSNGRQLLSKSLTGNTFCTDLWKTRFPSMNLKSSSKRILNQS